MSPLPAPTSAVPRASRLAPIAVAALAFALALALAWTSGAATSGFGSHEDEPAHLVTGLMVRDYIAQGFPGSPIDFAKRYYLHYPKVAIGHWPPGFPGIVGVWTLVFGTAHASLLALMAAHVAVIAALLFVVARASLGAVLAACAAALLALLPLVQSSTQAVMTELPLTLFCTLAVVAFGRWLDDGRARQLALFALAAVAAAYTKGIALFLAAVPFVAVAFAGRWSALRRPSLWLAGLAIALACAPWYLFTFGVAHTSWGGGGTPTVAYARDAARVYAAGLVGLVGAIGALLVGWGAVARLGRDERRGTWAALVAWPACLVVGLLLVPTGADPRHLVLAAPCWLALWAAGIAELAAFSRAGRLALPAAATLALGAFGLDGFARPRKDYRGYERAAGDLLADPTLADSVFLVASDSKGEGLFIGDVALRERRMGHFVLRASKVLASSDWLGRDYQPSFATVDELADFLADVPVGVVAIDGATVRHHWFRHHDQLVELVGTRPERWTPIGTYDVWRNGVLHAGALRLYRQVGHEGRAPGELDFGAILGRDLPSF